MIFFYALVNLAAPFMAAGVVYRHTGSALDAVAAAVICYALEPPINVSK